MMSKVRLFLWGNKQFVQIFFRTTSMRDFQKTVATGLYLLRQNRVRTDDPLNVTENINVCNRKN